MTALMHSLGVQDHIDMLVGPWALEQLVSQERLTYIAYFVLLTCFLVFVQNKYFTFVVFSQIKVFTK